VAEKDGVAGLEAEIASLRTENAELRDAISELKNKIADLETKLGQTSKDSSAPPSRDPNSARAEAKQNRAERRKTARKQGKQPGSQGRHLAQVENPDHRKVHRPSTCGGCGADLGGARVVGSEKRQVFDLPPIKTEVTEHVSERVVCRCGHVTNGVFPSEATAPACWGPGVKALGLYLTHRQHIPLARAAEMLSDVLGASVSTGFLAGLALLGERLLAPFVSRAKELLAVNPVIHADETTIRVSSEGWWLHVMACTTVTLLVCHEHRGHDAIDAIGVLPGYDGIVVHDGLAAYDYLENARHAQCCAHLLRHLAKAMRHDDTKLWARLMTEALLDCLAAARRAAGDGRDKVPTTSAGRLKVRYRHAIDVAFRTLPQGPLPKRRNTGGWAPHQRDAYNLAMRFRDDEADILRFISNTLVPFTNNDAERPLRPAKLHDKISGCFRNSKNAEAFATIRSYIATAAKHDKNLFEIFVELFTTGPWLPPDAQPG
jgi:transposase